MDGGASKARRRFGCRRRDFSGFFCHPPLPAFNRYVELCAEVMRRRGGDPDIGLKLPALLVGAGVTIGGVGVTHPADLDGDVKLLGALSMEAIADAVVAESLATREQVDRVIAALHEDARDALDLRATLARCRSGEGWPPRKYATGPRSREAAAQVARRSAIYDAEFRREEATSAVSSHAKH